MTRSTRNRTARTRPHTFRPRLDALEERALLSTFVVNTVSDVDVAGGLPAGQESLRQAIEDANADADPAGTSIVFDIPGAGVQTIQPVGAGLPVITHPVVVDGWSQGGSGYTGSPLIELDGDLGAAYGLAIGAADCTIRGLTIDRFTTDRFIADGAVYFFGSYGIFSAGADAVIEGSFIGTDPTGTQALPNTNGIWVGGTGSRVGSDGDGNNDPSERNLISGNSEFGIQVVGAGIVVAGNDIGTDVYGTSRLGNLTGVQITGPSRLGFDGIAAHPEAQRNIISGNSFCGVDAGDRAVIAGNYIGPDKNGAGVFGADGLFLGNGWGFHGQGEAGIKVSDHVLVGTDADGVGDEAERNVISGNARVNIDFGGSDSVVAGNYIGTTRDGMGTDQDRSPVSISGVGYESGSHDNRLGTDGMKGEHDQAERNIISGNGINVIFGNSWNNVVAGNYIGPDKDGANPMPNGLGMFVNGSNNRIGTNGDGNGDADERNVISANTGNQIWINGAPGTVVAGNDIGPDASGTRSLTQAGTAILIQGASAAETRIANNLLSGIIGGAAVGLVQTTNIEITGNSIGVASDGTSSLADSDGVKVVDSTDIQIEGNVIAFIPSFGVAVLGSSHGVSVRGNSIHDTSAVGIDLGEDGFTLNDSHLHSSGPNFWQNFPVLSAAYAGSSTVVMGALNSTPCTTFTIDFYANATSHPTGYGEGQTYLGSTTMTTDASGNASFTASGLAPASLGQWISATATAPDGSTSEFAQDVKVTQALTTTTLSTSANPSILNQPVTFTATITTPVTGLGMATGSVQFIVDGSNVGSPVPLSGGVATINTSNLPVGAHTIQATYSGDSLFLGSSASLMQAVQYRFSGFQAPLNQNLTFALNRTIPIRFTMSDFNNAAITSLGAVTSLQIASGTSSSHGTSFNPASSDKAGLHLEGTTFALNWQTKGLAAGNYVILLTLADGTVQARNLTLSANGASAGLMSDGTVNTGPTGTGALQGGDLALYVDNASGLFTGDELARIDDAVAAENGVLAPYGVTIIETSDSSSADVVIDTSATTSVGGLADGVLGCETTSPASTEITLVQGWNWYAGSDPTAVGAGQFDFETVVMHELGHALGLGHSASPTSVMYAMLAAGAASRHLAVADLNVPAADGEAPAGLHVRLLSRVTPTRAPAAMEENRRIEAELPAAMAAIDQVLEVWTPTRDAASSTFRSHSRAMWPTNGS